MSEPINSFPPLNPQDSSEDEVLRTVREIQAGVRVELNCERIYRKFRPLIRSFFLRRGFSYSEGDDLTQDVFLRVFKSMDSFRGESRFERWLWEIATHIYLNEVRRQKTEKRGAPEQSLDAMSESGEVAPPASSVPAPGLSPEEELTRKERSKAFHAALKELPDQMRRCCILRYEKGLKYKEIAVIMKISIETVKAHLHQARKRLKDLLGDTDS